MRRYLVLVSLLPLAAIAMHCSSFGDDSPSGDAGTDAGADAGADGPLCASPHDLCDDFNRMGAPLDPSRWSGQLGEGGVLAMPAFATSPALEVAVVDLMGTGYRLQKSIAGPLRSVHCSFRLYLEDTGVAFAGIPFKVSLAGSSSDYTAYFDLRGKGDPRPGLVVEDAPEERTVDFFTMVTGAWLTLELEAPVLRLWLNGVEKLVPARDGGAPSGPFASASIELGFGLYGGPDPGWRAALDDITCDVTR